MFIKKVILSTTIILCLGFISCKETNEPIIIPEESEIFFEGPIIINSESFSSGGGGWVDRASLRISDVLIGSDIIFVGKTSKINRYPFTVDIEITEVIKGATNEKTVTLKGSNAAATLEIGGVDLFFICKDGDGFVFTTEKSLGRSFYSVMWLERVFANETYYVEIDNIKLIYNAYKKNKELFSKSGKQDFFKLGPQLESGSYGSLVAGRFLYEIDYLVETKVIDKEDIPALLEWRRLSPYKGVIEYIEYILRYQLGWDGE